MTYRYWDAGVFLAWLKNEQPWAAQCMPGVQEAEAGRLIIVTSALSLAETLYLIRGEKPVSKEVRQAIRDFFERDYVRLSEVDRATAERAQDVIWDYGIKPKDAIHVATALQVGEIVPIEQLDTFDGPLASFSGRIEGLQIGQPNYQANLISDAAAHGGDALTSGTAGASLEGEVSP